MSAKMFTSCATLMPTCVSPAGPCPLDRDGLAEETGKCSPRDGETDGRGKRRRLAEDKAVAGDQVGLRWSRALSGAEGPAEVGQPARILCKPRGRSTSRRAALPNSRGLARSPSLAIVSKYGQMGSQSYVLFF